MKKIRLGNYISTLLYLIPVTLLLTVSYRTWLDPASPAAGLVITSVISMAVLTLFLNLNKRGRLILAGILAEFLLVTVLIVWKRGSWDSLTEKSWILYECGICLLSFILVLLMNAFHPFRIITGIGLFAGLILLMVFQTEVSRYFVLSALFIILLCLIEIIQYVWKKKGYTDRRKHLAALSPFLILLLVLFLLFRAPEEPYDWQFFINLYTDTVSLIERTTTNILSGFGDSYESSVVGFSGKGKLSGHIRKQAEDIMQLQSESVKNSVLYLAGKVCDSYDGREWTNTSESDINFRIYDLLETYAAVKRCDPSYVSDYLKNKTADLFYTNFRSRFIFTPLKSNVTETGFDRYNISFTGGFLKAEKKINNGEYYTLHYYQVNQNSTVMKKLLASLEPVDETYFKTALDALGFKSEDYSYEEFQTYRDEVIELNSEEIVLTDRVQKFLEEATEGAETDYDKLKALEKAFSDFEYTTDPGSIPKTVTDASEFLDYFLFENPRGFCSYYATAFVLLARSMGIPARYVQGYYVNVGNGVTNISSADAHAWPECYIEGCGWMAFEPTPGYLQEISWAPAARNTGSGDNGSGYSDPVNPEDIAGDLPMPEETQDTETEEEEAAFVIDWQLVLIYAGLALLTGLVLLIAELVIVNLTLRRKNNRDQIRIMYRRNMRMLKMLGYVPEEGETLSEFKIRASETVSDRALDFIPCFEALLYADEEATDKLRRRAVISAEYMAEDLKKNTGIRYGFLYLRILMQL